VPEEPLEELLESVEDDLLPFIEPLLLPELDPDEGVPPP